MPSLQGIRCQTGQRNNRSILVGYVIDDDGRLRKGAKEKPTAWLFFSRRDIMMYEIS